jgi:hypothetical protein
MKNNKQPWIANFCIEFVLTLLVLVSNINDNGGLFDEIIRLILVIAFVLFGLITIVYLGVYLIHKYNAKEEGDIEEVRILKEEPKNE